MNHIGDDSYVNYILNAYRVLFLAPVFPAGEQQQPAAKDSPMTQERTNSTGASVTVTTAPTGPLGAYIVSVDGVDAGRVDFLDPPGRTDERIVFHTEVDEQFAGRGLAGLLLREVLADISCRNLILVPVCPLFGRHLKKHGDEYRAGGGLFRLPTPADFAVMARASRTGS